MNFFHPFFLFVSDTDFVPQYLKTAQAVLVGAGGTLDNSFFDNSKLILFDNWNEDV
jgi:hypothetical protein